ncbi:hypothetical protein [Thermococcus sp.]
MKPSITKGISMLAVTLVIAILTIFALGEVSSLHALYGSRGNAGSQGNVTPYVYSTSDIQLMFRKHSLSDFSGTRSYPWVSEKIIEFHSELLKANCSTQGTSETFYKDNISVLSPTLTYMAYRLFECKGTNVTKEEAEYVNKTLSKYSERFKLEDTSGISPERALGELILYWQLPKRDPQSIALSERVVIPYLEIISINSSSRPLKFGISNITELRKTLKRIYTSKWRTMEGKIAFRGAMELNESEEFYRMGYISAAYWHYCLALGYYNVSKSRWANVPGYGVKNMIEVQKDRPYNITGIRDRVYSDALELFKTSSKPCERDLFGMYILQDIHSADKSLFLLTDKKRFLYTLIPSEIYESYLSIEAEIMGANIFRESFDLK